MSRIGKKPIEIPERFEARIEGDKIIVKGPLGELSRHLGSNISVKIAEGKITLIPKEGVPEQEAIWGTYASHISNMIKGVGAPYEEKVILEGIGFKSEVKGQEMLFALGFSHQVKLPIPKGLKVTAEKNMITISGIDKEAVGQFAAKVRSLKEAEPYKGKGFRYADEVVRRKEGKKSV